MLNLQPNDYTLTKKSEETIMTLFLSKSNYTTMFSFVVNKT